MQEPNTQLPVLTLFLTGNKYFNIFIRKRAQSLHYKLSNTQLVKNNKLVPVRSEQDIFHKLHLYFIPPKYRSFHNLPIPSIWDKSHQITSKSSRKTT